MASPINGCAVSLNNDDGDLCAGASMNAFYFVVKFNGVVFSDLEPLSRTWNRTDSLHLT